MNPAATLYEILEISPHASSEVIRAAYRCLAQSNHPDKNCGSAAAGARQAQINFAYGVLSDPRQRQRYDQRLGSSQASELERRGAELAPRACTKPAADAPPVSRAFAFRPLG